MLLLPSLRRQSESGLRLEVDLQVAEKKYSLSERSLTPKHHIDQLIKGSLPHENIFKNKFNSFLIKIYFSFIFVSIIDFLSIICHNDPFYPLPGRVGEKKKNE